MRIKSSPVILQDQMDLPVPLFQLQLQLRGARVPQDISKTLLSSTVNSKPDSVRDFRLERTEFKCSMKLLRDSRGNPEPFDCLQKIQPPPVGRMQPLGH